MGTIRHLRRKLAQCTDTMLDPLIESLMEAFDEFHSMKSKMDGLRGMRDGAPITKSRLVPDPKRFHKVQVGHPLDPTES